MFHFFQKCNFLQPLWCEVKVYLQQDQVDLEAPLLPSDRLGPGEKKETTHEDLLTWPWLDFRLCIWPTGLHVQLHHSMPIQPGLTLLAPLEMCVWLHGTALENVLFIDIFILVEQQHELEASDIVAEKLFNFHNS